MASAEGEQAAPTGVPGSAEDGVAGPLTQPVPVVDGAPAATPPGTPAAGRAVGAAGGAAAKAGPAATRAAGGAAAKAGPAATRPPGRPDGDAAPRRRAVGNRLLPRTVVGLATMVLAASIGAAFSGAVLYSYYEYRLQKTNQRVNALINTYQRQFNNAAGDLAAQAAADKAQIDRELGPLNQLQASGATLQSLLRKITPSLFFVHTLDVNGQPSVGTAFAIQSDPNRTLLLTSYTTVAAATRRPGPEVFVRQGNGSDLNVPIYSWDPPSDLALIILPRGNIPVLHPAAARPPPEIGDRVFAVSAVGSLGGSAAQGTITDVGASGLQHTAPVGEAFQGGPLVDPQGDVLAVASRNYAPLNFPSDAVWFAPYVRSACNKVLTCPNGSLSAAGQPGA